MSGDVKTTTLYKVTVIGPQGIVKEFYLKDFEWGTRDLRGTTPDGKDMYVTGLGGQFMATIQGID